MGKKKCCLWSGLNVKNTYFGQKGDGYHKNILVKIKTKKADVRSDFQQKKNKKKKTDNYYGFKKKFGGSC